jgi:hypothetical protein
VILRNVASEIADGIFGLVRCEFQNLGRESKENTVMDIGYVRLCSVVYDLLTNSALYLVIGWVLIIHVRHEGREEVNRAYRITGLYGISVIVFLENLDNIVPTGLL